MFWPMSVDSLWRRFLLNLVPWSQMMRFLLGLKMDFIVCHFVYHCCYTSLYTTPYIHVIHPCTLHALHILYFSYLIYICFIHCSRTKNCGFYLFLQSHFLRFISIFSLPNIKKKFCSKDFIIRYTKKY